MRNVITKIAIDWVEIKNKCRTTVGKDPTENVPNKKFIKDLLVSEHSPIRIGRIAWRWKGIPSWVSVHFARHWLGWDKWVSTQRIDRTGVDRNKSPQDTPVDMDVEANCQALINVSRFRLCRQASDETRAYMEDIKRDIHDAGQEELAWAMVPNCIYRCGCPEFSCCEANIWGKFVKEANECGVNLANIKQRYDLYNELFFGVSEDE